jgi:hypothetical protein
VNLRGGILDDTNKQGGIIGSLIGWWSHPFNSQGSALNWVLFVGVLVIAAFLWQTVLILLTKEV